MIEAKKMVAEMMVPMNKMRVIFLKDIDFLYKTNVTIIDPGIPAN